MDELRDEFDDWFARTYKTPVPVYYRSIAWVAYKAGRESGYDLGFAAGSEDEFIKLRTGNE